MMYLKTIIDIINSLSLLQFVLYSLFIIITTSILVVKIISHLYRKERIFYRNLQRPIKVFKPKNCPMDSEINTLRKSGLFKIENPTEDLREVHNISNHSILVVGYKKDMKGFKNFIKQVMDNNLPLIIYTFGDSKALSDEIMKTLYSYPWYTISNTPLRLLSDIFTISSVYPYE